MENPTKLPQKRFFRQRAHVNIFNDMPLDYPEDPKEMDWSTLYPLYFKSSVKGRPNPDDQPIFPVKKQVLTGTGKTVEAVEASSDNPQAGEHVGTNKVVEFADIGCGYGGLLVALAPLFPDTLMLGMEIRTKLVNYLQKRIEALRTIQNNLEMSTSEPTSTETGNQASESKVTKEGQDIAENQTKNSGASIGGDDEGDDGDEDDDEYLKIQETGETTKLVAGKYNNIGVIRMNAMKYLPNFFQKGQLTKIFFLFPDPHFKKRKHKARIISSTLLAEYAYVTKVGGILYTVTDVEDLHIWMKSHLDSFPLFEYIPENELENDIVIKCVYNSTEEGRKVTRNNGKKFLACYRRIEDPMH